MGNEDKDSDRVSAVEFTVGKGKEAENEEEKEEKEEENNNQRTREGGKRGRCKKGGRRGREGGGNRGEGKRDYDFFLTAIAGFMV